MSDPNSNKQSSLTKFMIVLAALYIGEGMGQMGGIINQPLTLFLLKDQHWTATQIAVFFQVAAIPWLIKPLYGIISDFVPLLGYRRRSYLVLANGLAVLGYLWLAGMTQPAQIAIALVFTAVGMAMCSTVCGALLVERGKNQGLSGKFVSQQWLWFYIANIAAVLLAGQLCQHFSASRAVQISAYVAAATLVVILAVSWFFVEEEKSTLDVESLKSSVKGLWSALKSRTMWFVGLFVFAFYFRPSVGTPMFVYMTHDLQFHQDFIGFLGSVSAFGCIIGAVLYRMLTKVMSFKQVVYISIVLAALSQAAFVFLGTETSAVILNFATGVCSMIAVVAVLTLAADNCPDGSEGFTYALLGSLHNAASPLSAWAGAYLFDHAFNQQLMPLVLVSAGTAIFSLVLVPFLKLSKPKDAEKGDDKS